jgi:diguanylate cyclase (GGDEF)-like protein
MVQCDACAIMLIEGDKIRILAERGFSNTFGKMKFHKDIPAIRQILDTRKTIFTGDISHSNAAGCLPYGCFMNSLICVPLVVGDEVKGIIHLDSAEMNAFNSDDLEFAELMGKEIAMAVERSLLYSQVVDISTKDGLTGCFNRRKFDIDVVADVATAKQSKKPLSLLIADIDWFKHYNDFHGHPKGDELLKKLVRLLGTNIRGVDKVYRYGGEEFALTLPGTGKVNAVYVASRLREVVEAEQFDGEKESQPNMKVTISVGIATLPVDAKKWNELVSFADAALYRAKQTGRNKACAYNHQHS